MATERTSILPDGAVVFLDANRDAMLPSGTVISIQDFTAAITIYTRTLSDSADAADQQQAYENKLRILFSDITIDDALIRALQTVGVVIARTLTSDISVNDLVNRDGIFNRLLGSELNINDALQSFVGTIISRLLTSNIVLSDAFKTQKEVERLLVEAFVVTDAVLQDKNLVRLLQDNLTLVDAIARTVISAPQTYNRVLSDGADIQDAILAQVLNVVRGYILMSLENSGIVTSTKPSSINIDTKPSNIQIDTKE